MLRKRVPPADLAPSSRPNLPQAALKHEAVAAYAQKQHGFLQKEHARVVQEHHQLEQRHAELLATLRTGALAGWKRDCVAPATACGCRPVHAVTAVWLLPRPALQAAAPALPARRCSYRLSWTLPGQTWTCCRTP